MSSKHPSRKTDVSVADFPALRDFLRGYFHEDLADEYGSPESAAKQFWQDADREQRTAVAREWTILLNQTNNLSLDQVNESLRRLGSAWTFESLAEVRTIADIFRKSRPAH